MNIIPGWVRNYQKAWLSGDMVAGVIVTVMLIPQSLAYAPWFWWLKALGGSWDGCCLF